MQLSLKASLALVICCLVCASAHATTHRENDARALAAWNSYFAKYYDSAGHYLWNAWPDPARHHDNYWLVAEGLNAILDYIELAVKAETRSPALLDSLAALPANWTTLIRNIYDAQNRKGFIQTNTFFDDEVSCLL